LRWRRPRSRGAPWPLARCRSGSTCRGACPWIPAQRGTSATDAGQIAREADVRPRTLAQRAQDIGPGCPSRCSARRSYRGDWPTVPLDHELLVALFNRVENFREAPRRFSRSDALGHGAIISENLISRLPAPPNPRQCLSLRACRSSRNPSGCSCPCPAVPYFFASLFAGSRGGRPSATSESRPRKKSQPSACCPTPSSGSPRCTRRSRVPRPAGSRSISTVLDPGGTVASPSQPHVNTTRRLGTTSTYRPEATCLGSANCTRNVPPFVGSSSAIRPFHRTYSTGSVNSRNTVSGDASIVIVRSMTLVSTAMPAPPLFFLLRGGLQRAKARVPEV